MKNKIIYLLLLMSGVGFAQQEAQYTQYMYNTANVNPGYTGTRGCFSALVMHRSQWVGLEGAPKTNTVAMSTPLGLNNRMGLGVSVINDKIGPSDENAISVDLSYNINTSENSKLSFGIKGTANFFSVDFNKTKIHNVSDGLIRQNVDNRFFPNIGAGAFWYSDKTYVGLSIPFILEQKYYDNDVQYVASERMHPHLIAGHVFRLSSEVQFKPTTMIKYVNGAPLQVDLSGNFWFNEKFSLGAAYRWNAAWSAMAGFQINDSWLIGYAYDRDVTRLGNFNSGSHEVFLRYELFKRVEKVVAPRFF
ncbi:type IX secretion system membrane protein PorP/SprF [Flavobacterium columnare]|uniref:PorP/SprF family type IX secretion system membrane protein n=1 Tax=Flavobacterium columnare TaxID=996 RepID=UPI002D207E56|nr:type IX secretion system membrane protein PorP/SprF [Flavobacterium columnare]MEB3801805.1 type IX secretion system membrane protein PorP/SprF [Flavobacterium columnare]